MQLRAGEIPPTLGIVLGALLLLAALLLVHWENAESTAPPTAVPLASSYAGTDLPVMRITLPDGVNLQTIHWGSKDIKYKNAELEVESADGSDHSYYNQVTFKGHGNSTWMNDPKKPYQIRCKTKVNLFGLGASSRWLLISNSFDPSMLRNDFSYRIAQYMGMPGANKGQFVILYVDDEYLGVYYLCHKTEIGDATLDLKSETGILCEWDEVHPADEDDEYFEAPMSGKRILYIDHTYEENEETGEREFRAAFEALETALWSGDWETAASLIDVHSFAQYYVIQEFAKNEDGGASSFYMYKDGEDDVIHAGPVWDMDLAYGNAIYSADEHPEYNDVTGAHAFNQNDYGLITRMLAYQSFRDEVAAVWTNEFCPAYTSALEDIEVIHDAIAAAAEEDHTYWNRVSFEDGYAYFYAWITMRVPEAQALCTN